MNDRNSKTERRQTLEQKLGFDAVRARLEAHVRSALGEDRLAAIRPADSLDWLREELARVDELAEAFRYDDPVPLDNVRDVRETLRRAAPEQAYVDPEELHALRLVLVTLRRVKDYFEKRRADYPQLAEAVGRITPLEDLEQHVAGILDEEGRLRDNASEELLRLRRRIVQRQSDLREALNRAMRKAVSQGHSTEERPTMRAGRMVIPVRAEAKRKVEGFVHDTSATGQTVYIEPASCLELNNEVRELQAAERREIERILRQATSRVRSRLDALHANMRALAQFDLLQAKARLANELEAVVPETVAEDGVIQLREGRNPVLQLHFRRLAEQGEAEREVVPLDLDLGADYRTLVITGPNAGGKTVAMKTVGLFALMLSYGLLLPVAPHTRFDLFEQILVDIGDEQSIEDDLSTFSSHVSNLRAMLERAHPRTLVLIDEAGTGTDPAEGGALAQAVLERLTRAGARTVATTHHGTLKVYAHEAEHVENGSMAFDQKTLRPTYRFRAGVPGSSYAFDIAERIGLDAGVLDRAREIAGEQKTAMEELISTFEQRNQELKERLYEAEQKAKKAEEARSTFEGRVRKLEKQRDEIRRQALEEAERIVEGANARIEKTIREIKEAEAEREATRQARERFEEYREELKEDRQANRAPAEEEGAEPAGDGASEGPPLAPEAEIEEGDQVVLDEGTTKLEVQEVDGDEAVVLMGQMHMRVSLDRLTKVAGKREREEPVRSVPTGDTGVAALSAEQRADLRGYRVDEARQAVEQLLDEAVAANLHRVEILHGKGTGALRAAIHEYLATRPDVASFEEAPWNEGGAGVTYVELV